MFSLNKQLLSKESLAERKRTVRNITLRDSMFDGHNIWLLKPADASVDFWCPEPDSDTDCPSDGDVVEADVADQLVIVLLMDFIQ